MTAHGTPDDLAVGWLLDAGGPAVRLRTLRDVLGKAPAASSDDVLADDLVTGLLAGQEHDGGFGVHPYRKWSGGFWRLVSLADLGVPGDDPRVRALVAHVLTWLTGPTRRTRDRMVAGLTRHCASQDGLGLSAVCRLGHAGDPHAEQLARWLVQWQWPDGGWNCDVRASGRRSSMHETHGPIDGLVAFADATGATWARESADAAVELLLDHRVLEAVRPAAAGEVLHRSMLQLRYPAYWHYGLLRALIVLARAGAVGDPRTDDARDRLYARRASDGRWPSDGAWWRHPGARGSNVEVVDWGRGHDNAMLTLHALLVRRAAGDLDLSLRGATARS